MRHPSSFSLAPPPHCICFYSCVAKRLHLSVTTVTFSGIRLVRNHQRGEGSDRLHPSHVHINCAGWTATHGSPFKHPSRAQPFAQGDTFTGNRSGPGLGDLVLPDCTHMHFPEQTVGLENDDREEDHALQSTLCSLCVRALAADDHSIHLAGDCVQVLHLRTSHERIGGQM